MTKYTKRDNYVAPLPTHVEIVEIEHDLPLAPIVEPMPLASYTDRSIGFSLATMPLAGATGLVVVLVAVTGFGVPLASMAALLSALAGFSLVWLVAYVAHTFVSPDGALFVHTLAAWAYLKREQKERHKRYESLRAKGGDTYE